MLCSSAVHVVWRRTIPNLALNTLVSWLIHHICLQKPDAENDRESATHVVIHHPLWIASPSEVELSSDNRPSMSHGFREYNLE